MKVSTMPDPPPVSYSDKVGYRDNVDDIEALASRAMSPISDFPPGDDYDEEDHSITSSDEDEDHGDMSLSDEEGQRDATALRKKTSDILNEFEGFVKDVNESSSTSMEIMNTLTWTRGDTVKSRITSGGGDAALNREWSREERNLHDIRFGSNDDDYSSGGYNKYEKRRFFKYAIPFFHSKKFKAIAAGVAVVLVLMVIVGSVSSTSDREDVGEMNGVVMVEDFDDSGTVSIDTSTCEDHPTAKITPDGHTCEDFIAHVGRVPLHNARCSHLATSKNEKGEPLFVKDVCRLSCGVCGDAWTQGPQEEEEEAGMPQAQTEVLNPADQQSTPATLNDASSSPVTECKDDLTKVVAIGGKNCETYFSDSTMVHLKELRCSHQTDIKDDSAINFLLVKDICKKTCGICTATGQIKEESSTNTAVEASTQIESPSKVIIQNTQAQTEGNGVDFSASAASKPGASSTVSIDASKCEDNPTATITTDGHTCEDFIAHVGRVPLHNARCSHESPLRNEKGEPLLVKEVCRLSCGMCGDAWTQGPQEGDAGMPQAQTEGSGVSSGAVVTEPEAPKPQPPQPGASSTVSIDASKCEDNPTATITTDGHTCEDFIAHVGRVPLHNARCSHESPLRNEKGEPLLVKEVCRLSCGMCGDAWTQGPQEEDAGMPQAQTEVANPSIQQSTAQESQVNEMTNWMTPVTLNNDSSSPELEAQTEGSGGSSGAVVTEPEAPKPQPPHPEVSSTVSIDASKCEDNPTATITTDGHTCEDFIAHVGRVPLHNARCSHESPLRNEKGEPLLVKEVCRLSCGMCGDAWTQGPQEEDTEIPPAQVESPATVDSPPQDTMPSSLGTAQAQSNAFETKPVELVSPPSSATAQVEPVPSQSIQQTQESSNMQIPEKTTENTVSNTNNLSIQSKPASVSGLPEQQAYNFVGKRYEPVWFDRSSGWQGTTYEAAVQFCLSLEQNRILCPYEAYCPLGPHTEVPFGGFRDGGAWAPAINSREWWVQVGHTENTCKHANFDQNWGQDGSNEEQTRNIMCCLYEN